MRHHDSRVGSEAAAHDRRPPIIEPADAPMRALAETWDSTGGRWDSSATTDQGRATVTFAALIR